MESIGVSKSTDKDGKETYNYTAPTATKEEIAARISSGESPREKAVLDLISKREGVSGDAGYDMILGDSQIGRAHV